MTNQELLSNLERIKAMMVSVSTGQQRIQEVESEYQQLYSDIDIELSQRNIENLNIFLGLWEWYGHWSSGDLPSYQSRRQYLSTVFNPMIQQVRRMISGNQSAVIEEPTGWERVDRTILEIRRQLSIAENEEQFQAIGLLCRETLITLGQSVYDPDIHPSIDGTVPSSTDAKRMLENYIGFTLSGSSHEKSRKHAKASFDLANDLQHRRTANFRQAALCAEATASVINVIAIISGRRDP